MSNQARLVLMIANIGCTQAWFNARNGDTHFVTVTPPEHTGAGDLYYQALSPEARAAKREKSAVTSARKRDARRDSGLRSEYAGEQVACPEPTCRCTWSRSNYSRGMTKHLMAIAKCREWVESCGDFKQRKYLPSQPEK